MIVDFRTQQREHPPIHIDGTVAERVESFLSVHVTDKLKWSTQTVWGRKRRGLSKRVPWPLLLG